jgi:glycerol-3-phosphate acyltransferase PlsY
VARLVGGLDLRQHGSGNLGATNLYRALGWKAAVPVGLFDVAKGAVPVALMQRAGGGAEWWPLAVGLAAVLGHVFSPFVRFRGGKGVATAAGMFLALAPWSLVVGLVVWLLVVKLSGYVSLGSMLASVAFVASLPVVHAGVAPSTVIAAAVVMVFIVFTHRANIGRLLAGTESRFGRPTAPPPASAAPPVREGSAR